MKGIAFDSWRDNIRKQEGLAVLRYAAIAPILSIFKEFYTIISTHVVVNVEDNVGPKMVVFDIQEGADICYETYGGLPIDVLYVVRPSIYGEE